MLLGKTTSERFAFQQKRKPVEGSMSSLQSIGSVSSLSEESFQEKEKGKFVNCCAMCCNCQVKNQEHLIYEKEGLIHSNSSVSFHSHFNSISYHKLSAESID
jgi:hypothetical protein